MIVFVNKFANVICWCCVLCSFVMVMYEISIKNIIN